jgi:hypothetical protein
MRGDAARGLGAGGVTGAVTPPLSSTMSAGCLRVGRAGAASLAGSRAGVAAPFAGPGTIALAAVDRALVRGLVVERGAGTTGAGTSPTTGFCSGRMGGNPASLGGFTTGGAGAGGRGASAGGGGPTIVFSIVQPRSVPARARGASSSSSSVSSVLSLA